MSCTAATNRRPLGKLLACLGARHAVPTAAADEAPSPAPASAAMEAPAPLRRRLRRERIVLGAALLLLAVLILALSLRSPETVSRTRPVRFAFTPGTNVAGPVISPNGRHIAYIAGDEETKLWVQDLDRQEPRELGVAASRRPEGRSGLFWSPNSDFIAFTEGRELKRIPVGGGAAISLCPLPQIPFASGAWSPDRNTIVFTVGVPPSLYKVASEGGPPRAVDQGARE